MFSEQTEKLDVSHFNEDEVFENFKESSAQAPQLDLVLENYMALVNQLKNDLDGLRSELAYHKKVHGEITESIDEFFTIQKLSSIITQSLEYDEIVQNLNEIAVKIIPHQKNAVFLREEQFVAIGDAIDPDFELILQNMMEEGILDWLWEQGNPIVVPINDFVLIDGLKMKSGNIVIAPMMQNQEGMGIFLIHTEKEQANFSFHDLGLLNILTQQAAIAIQYTRLYKKLSYTHEALKNSQSRLMQTIKLATVGELAEGIAHEINNPLQIILGNIQMAMMGFKPEESLKIVETQAMRIANIVRGLLSMAKQKSVSASEYLEINPLIMNTINLVRGQIEKRGISIHLDLSNDLPVVMGSSVYFQQILLNFVLHAKKQIERNGEIHIQSRKLSDNSIEIKITDSGVSLPDEYVRKIMNPFEDIENSSEMNLGLTVSVQMIRDIGGSVTIENEGDTGNEICMKIPKAEPKKDNYESDTG